MFSFFNNLSKTPLMLSSHNHTERHAHSGDGTPVSRIQI